MILKYTSHPHINSVIKRFNDESHYFSKLHRLIDCFEIIIKTHAAYVICNYFEIKKISGNVKELLAEGLISPSLGLWQVFSRVIMKEIDSPVMFLPEFTNYFWKYDKYISNEINNGEGNEKIKDIFCLRNKYAHGATPDEEMCREEILRYIPVANKLISVQWLQETTISSFLKKDGIILPINTDNEENSFIDRPLMETIAHNSESIKEYTPYLIKRDGRMMSMFPIMICDCLNETGAYGLYFLNDLKKVKVRKAISLLNYPYANHRLNWAIYQEFLSIIDISNWKNKTDDRFKQLVESYSESFKGRLQEQEIIHNFIRSCSKGYFFVSGSPGVGKSSLMAEIVKSIKYSGEGNRKADSNIICIEHFIKRAGSSEGMDFLDRLNICLDNILPPREPCRDNLKEKKLRHEERLRELSLKSQKKLVILIDGLDEGIGSDTGFLDFMINDLYDNILIIFSGRSTAETEDFYRRLPVEYKSRLRLGGLSKEEIKSILFEVGDKYRIINNSDYVDKIADMSSGNPLYLKLLCKNIENGEYTLEDVIKNRIVPRSIEELYEPIIRSFARKVQGNIALRALNVIASAEDYMNAKLLQIILGINQAEAEIALEELQEILRESKENKGYYQLFHESLRSYLENTRKDDLLDAEEALVEYCSKWKKFKKYSGLVGNYPLKYYSSHLKKLDYRDELMQLACDDEYEKAQMELAGGHLNRYFMYKIAAEVFHTDPPKLIQIICRNYKLQQKFHGEVGRIIEAPIDFNLAYSNSVIDQIRLYGDKTKFILYVLLMDKLFYQPDVDITAVREGVSKILKEIDDNIEYKSGEFNWCDFISVPLMVGIIEKVIEIGEDPIPIFKRGLLSNFEDKKIRKVLSSLNLDDTQCFQAFTMFLIYDENNGVRSKVQKAISPIDWALKRLVKIQYKRENKNNVIKSNPEVYIETLLSVGLFSEAKEIIKKFHSNETRLKLLIILLNMDYDGVFQKDAVDIVEECISEINLLQFSVERFNYLLELVEISLIRGMGIEKLIELEQFEIENEEIDKDEAAVVIVDQKRRFSINDNLRENGFRSTRNFATPLKKHIKCYSKSDDLKKIIRELEQDNNHTEFENRNDYKVGIAQELLRQGRYTEAFDIAGSKARFEGDFLVKEFSKLVGRNDFLKAIQILKLSKDAYTKSAMLTCLSRVNFNEAEQLIKDFLKHVRIGVIRAKQISNLIIGYKGQKRLEEAEAYSEVALEVAKKINGYNNCEREFIDLLVLLLSMGKLNLSNDFFKTLSPHIQMELFCTQANISDVRLVGLEVEKIIEKAKDVYAAEGREAKIRGAAKILGYIYKISGEEEAGIFLDKLMGELNNEQVDSYRIEGLGEIGLQLNRIGKKEEAFKLLKEAAEAVMNCNEDISNLFVKGHIARKLVQCGYIEESIPVLKKAVHSEIQYTILRLTEDLINADNKKGIFIVLRGFNDSELMDGILLSADRLIDKSIVYEFLNFIKYEIKDSAIKIRAYSRLVDRIFDFEEEIPSVILRLLGELMLDLDLTNKLLFAYALYISHVKFGESEEDRLDLKAISNCVK